MDQTGFSAGRFGRPDLWPADWPARSPAGLSAVFSAKKGGGGDGLNRKVRRVDKSAEPQVRFNPVS